MLTVTIGKPKAAATKSKDLFTSSVTENEISIKKEVENHQENEIEGALLRGRKAIITGDEIIQDIAHLNPTPTRPLPHDIPTFVIQEPNQNIGDILLK